MSTRRLEKCQLRLHHMYVSTLLSNAHIWTAQQSVSVSRRRQVEPPQQKVIVVWGDGRDVVSTAVPTRPRNLFTVPSVRRPEIRGKAHHHICPVHGPVNLSTQNTLCLVLYTVNIGRCLCTHAPCRFRGGMAIQRDALSTSTPPNTGTHVTGQSKYHTDSTTLIGLIGKEWRKPAILLPPTPVHPCPRGEQHGPSLGRVVLWETWHTPPPPQRANGDPRRDSASGRIRQRFRPRKQGKVRPPGFLARGAARLMRIGGGQHTLLHTHAHPPPPGQQF